MVERTKTKIVVRLILIWALVIAGVIFFALNLSACEPQSEETAVISNENIVEVAEVIEAESVEPETEQETESAEEITEGWGSSITYVDKEPVKTDYIPYQDRYDRDWDSHDESAMMKLAQYKGGSVEDKAYNMLVVLNRSKEWGETVTDVALDELYNTEGISEGDFPDIVPDDDCKIAMYNIVREKFDNSEGSTEFRNQKKEEVESESEEAEESRTYLGNYKITAYAETGNPCANGNYPQTDYTIACNSLPFGSIVYIEDVGYRTVEDRGASWHEDEWIDLYLGDTASCIQWGVQHKDVYLVEE